MVNAHKEVQEEKIEETGVKESMEEATAEPGATADPENQKEENEEVEKDTKDAKKEEIALRKQKEKDMKSKNLDNKQNLENLETVALKGTEKEIKKDVVKNDLNSGGMEREGEVKSVAAGLGEDEKKKAAANSGKKDGASMKGHELEKQKKHADKALSKRGETIKAKAKAKSTAKGKAMKHQGKKHKGTISARSEPKADGKNVSPMKSLKRKATNEEEKMTTNDVKKKLHSVVAS